jgi:hypothetical protein
MRQPPLTIDHMPRDRKRLHFQKYDGVTFRQVYRLDVRLLVPGIMLIMVSIPLVIWTWPILQPLLVTGIGGLLVALAFAKRMTLEVSPAGYVSSWSIGPVGWTMRGAADEVRPYASRGRHGVYSIWLKWGLRSIETFIRAQTHQQAQQWCVFLCNVSRGEPAQIPREGHWRWDCERSLDQ